MAVNPTRRSVPGQQGRIRPQFQSDFSLTTDATGVFNSSLERSITIPINATIDVLDTIPIGEVQGFKEPAIPWYSDQVLPFDITLAAANEYGAAASAKLFGVEILNEGYGMSIDDSVSEMQATFVARTISPLQAVGLRVRTSSASLKSAESAEVPGVTLVCGILLSSRITAAPVPIITY